MKSNFELMAAYNQKMNISIYEVVSRLSEDEIKQQRGAFFGSVLGTLNHLLVGDIIWLKRFAHHEANFPSLDYVNALELPTSLDATLHSTFSDLAHQRIIMDQLIVKFTAELTEFALTSSLVYRNTNGVLFKKKIGYLLQHFFNHQTHHRGQVSTLLYQAGVDVGITDLLMCIPDE